MRSVDAPVLLERFLVAAASTLVGIRIYLALTGYPQIGGHGLHIAHLLWGGLLMLVSLVLLLGFTGRDLRLVVAVVAGAGWGAFFDELGKFITSDVNYFYRPTLSLIYAGFIVLFIAVRSIVTESSPTPRSALAQSLELIQAGVIRGLRPRERDQAIALLARADAANPLVPALELALAQSEVAADHRGGLGDRLRRWVGRHYNRLRQTRAFIPLVVGLVVTQGAVGILDLVMEIVGDPAFLPDSPAFSWSDVLKAISVGLGGALSIAGAIALVRDRWHGWRLIRAGLLVFLLLVQPLSFYSAQLLALSGLTFSLLLFAAVSSVIGNEEAQLQGVNRDGRARTISPSEPRPR
ncbi:MAG: hypothetical protein H0U10_09490 [Chloroflexia bacterium]|nr:hypothetical protein [Chloroflexia bacterium]